jgi:hypothetical protein
MKVKGDPETNFWFQNIPNEKFVMGIKTKVRKHITRSTKGKDTITLTCYGRHLRMFMGVEFTYCLSSCTRVTWWGTYLF